MRGAICVEEESRYILCRAFAMQQTPVVVRVGAHIDVACAAFAFNEAHHTPQTDDTIIKLAFEEVPAFSSPDQQIADRGCAGKGC